MSVLETTIDQLTTDKNNANAGTVRGRYLLDHSLREFGAGRSILVDKEGRVIAGNKTLEAAADIGLEDVVIVQTDGTKLVAVQRTDLDLDNGDDKARLMAYADNRASEVGLAWEPTAIQFDLEAGLDLSGMFQEFELGEILVDIAPDPVPDPGAQVDKAAELQEKWGVQRGQIFQVGRHKIMCGDSTDAGDVGRLMGGEKAVIGIHDPPYGQAWLSNHYGPNRSAPNPQGKIEGDDKPRPELLTEWVNVLDNDGALYVCTRWTLCEVWCKWLSERLKVRNVIVWAKNNWSAGDLEGAYGFMYEQVIFAAKGNHKLRGSRLPDVWQFDRVPPGQHPTQKPAGLFARCIEKSTDTAAIVTDGFVGSGTTLVACEQTGRVGYGMEIEPKYVAVTLERLAGMGLEPRAV